MAEMTVPDMLSIYAVHCPELGRDLQCLVRLLVILLSKLYSKCHVQPYYGGTILLGLQNETRLSSAWMYELFFLLRRPALNYKSNSVCTGWIYTIAMVLTGTSGNLR